MDDLHETWIEAAFLDHGLQHPATHEAHFGLAREDGLEGLVMGHAGDDELAPGGKGHAPLGQLESLHLVAPEGLGVCGGDALARQVGEGVDARGIGPGEDQAAEGGRRVRTFLADQGDEGGRQVIPVAEDDEVPRVGEDHIHGLGGHGAVQLGVAVGAQLDLLA